MDHTAELSAFCAALSPGDIPEPVRARTRLLLVDLLGAIVRARAEASATPSLVEMVYALGWDLGSVRVFGDEASYGPAGAAFLNSALGHALDFDDTHAAATLHPGAPVISAALAAGDLVNASGGDVLAAIVAGYEVICRTALSLPAGDHYARGFHPTATCGVFGAAAAAGRVFGLTAAEIESALGIALSQSAGSLQFLADGAWTKPFQVGWAAMAGLAAAILARKGFKGPSQALEGAHGFLQAYAPNPAPQRLIEGLGQGYELMATGVKPYPSCRYGHAGIDAMLSLRAEHGLEPHEIDKIVYGLSRAGLLLVGAPAELKQNPKNTVGAQFSAPFVLATALVMGAMTWDSYRDLDNPTVRALMSRVECVHDRRIEAEFPANMSGTVTVHARGRTYVKTVIVPLGEPTNFLGQDAILTKYAGLARTALGDRAIGLANCALGFDALPSIRDLTRWSAAA